jgi:hypothetical protein
MEAARTLSAVFGLGAVLVLYALAWQITRRRLVALAFAALVGLSPWLFENSRVAFDLSILPLLLALLLLTLWRASTGVWRLRHSLAVGALLAAVTYSYQVGRLLGPLLAIGVALCWLRRWRQVAVVWAVFLAGVAPIVVWAHRHPSALGARYHATTWLHAGMSPWSIAGQFLEHYAKNLDLWAWVVSGATDVEDHVRGDGSLFFVEVVLALAGLVIVLAGRRRADPFWRFVLVGLIATPVAASFVSESQSGRRMIALPVFLPLLGLPALEAIARLENRRARAAIATAVLAAFAFEAVHWQVVYDRNGPGRGATFDAAAPGVIADAYRHGKTVYAFRFDHSQYIDLLLYGTLQGRKPSSRVILASSQRPRVGALFVGQVAECRQCPRLAAKDNFVAYRYRPAPPGVVRTHFQLNSPLLPVGSPLQFLVSVDNPHPHFADHLILYVRLPGTLRLTALPYHQRGSCTISHAGRWYEPRATSTITCNIGFLPGRSSTVIRYQVVALSGSPQVMHAWISSDQLNVNPVGTGSTFTVDLTPPAYARAGPPAA